MDWHFHVLLIVDIVRFNILNRGHTAFEFGKPFKNSCLPIVWSLKATLNFPKVSVAFLPGLNKTLMQEHCSVKFVIL